MDNDNGYEIFNYGLGNDVYTISNDKQYIVETAAGGIDLVKSGISYSLLDSDGIGNFGGAIENLMLTGSAVINGTGNSLNNVLTGNAFANTLDGLGGNDTLDGGLGIDTMTGGDGSDTYYVRDSGDRVIETNAVASTGGTDHVHSYLSSYTLGANLENGRIVTTGTAGLTGNNLNNTLWAGTGSSVLSGGAGADTLIGGAGNDSLDGGVTLDHTFGSDDNFTTYNYATAGVNINLSGITGNGSTGSGTASGNASVGVDSLKNISSVQGSSFNDTITGSSALIFENFEGGAGNDILNGGAITDLINGDNDNRVSYQNITGAGVTVDFIAGTAVGAVGSNAGSDLLSNFNMLRGSNFNDTLLGSNRTDTVEQFEGRLGNDYIDGRGGSDIVRYQSATSQVIVDLATGLATGAMGNDTLVGIEGARGGSGNDILIGGNALNGVTVNDGLMERFRGEAGNDTIDGGQGYDRVEYASSTAGVMVILNDTLDGSASDGLGGTDVLRGIEGVRGSMFADVLTGSSSAAFESFEGREGNDTINGNGGVDRIDYQFSRAGVTVNLTTGVASDGYNSIDTLSNIENVRGSQNFSDSIIGSAVNNKLEGLGGNDTLNGGSGNDTLLGGFEDDWLTGGAGVDSIDGGAGSDVAFFADGTNGVVINLRTGTISNDGFGNAEVIVNVENLHGSAFADTIQIGDINGYVFGRAGNDSITGGNGNDNLIGGSGNDTMDGGAGLYDTVAYHDDDYDSAGISTHGVTVNLAMHTATDNWGFTDTLTGIENVKGSEMADTIAGDTANNHLDGAEGHDLLSGDAGTDALMGGMGNDTILAGAGNDILTGGLGADKLTGGTGADWFDFNALAEMGLNSSTWDTITDFKISEGDKLDLLGVDADTALVGDQAFSFLGAVSTFTGNATGQLRFDATAHILYGSTDADTAAEFAIVLTGVSSLASADLVL